MKKLLIIAIPIGILLIFIAVHSAHSLPFKGRASGSRDFLSYRLDRLGEKLNLTNEQKTELDALKRDLESMLDDRYEQRQNFRKTLGEQLAKEDFNTRSVTDLLHTQIDERARLHHELVNRVGELLNTLTPEQRQELSEIILRSGTQERDRRAQ